jgi:hypothetical protein
MDGKHWWESITGRKRVWDKRATDLLVTAGWVRGRTMQCTDTPHSIVDTNRGLFGENSWTEAVFMGDFLLINNSKSISRMTVWAK